MLRFLRPLSWMPRPLVWSLSILVCSLSLALEMFVFHTNMLTPVLGAKLRTTNDKVLVEALTPAVSAQDVLHVDDEVLAINGRSVTAAAFLHDPDLVSSWADRALFLNWQDYLSQSAARGSLTLTLHRGGLVYSATLPTHTMNWIEALCLGFPLRLIGWLFLFLFGLIWIKRPNEASLLGMFGGLGVQIAFCSMAAYIHRDLSIPSSTFSALLLINYLGSEVALLAVNMGWVWPTPVSWLPRFSWIRCIPWILYVVQTIMYISHACYSPAVMDWPLNILSLLILILTVSVRLIRATDPILKAQFLWLTMGCIVGFLPWILLSAIPSLQGAPLIREEYTLFFTLALPLCIAFAVFRYRLLDVELVFDWLLVHIIILGIFLVFELLFWNWLGITFVQTAPDKAILVSLGMFLLVFLYAPLRTWLLRLVTRASGREQPALAVSLRELLECARDSRAPTVALERTLEKTLRPSRLFWALPGQGYDLLLQQLTLTSEGALGYELGEHCPPDLESAAWIPVQTRQRSSAVLLVPQGARGWTRRDLNTAHTLVRASEPLLEVEEILRESRAREDAMREQREDLVRELHDGLGSQLFGALLLTEAAEEAPEQSLRKRLAEINSALLDAMDSLRAGLTVLGSPPGAFGPAVMALLMRSERILQAAGIALKTQVDDHTVSLHMNGRIIFSLLRTMQEALTNVARHSEASEVLVTISCSDSLLTIEIRDNGRGFAQTALHSGHGLKNMRRRLQLLTGSASIESTPDCGCTVRLTLPIAPEEI